MQTEVHRKIIPLDLTRQEQAYAEIDDLEGIKGNRKEQNSIMVYTTIRQYQAVPKETGRENLGISWKSVWKVKVPTTTKMSEGKGGA